MCSGDEELEGGRGRGMIVGQAQERATDTLAGWLVGGQANRQARQTTTVFCVSLG